MRRLGLRAGAAGRGAAAALLALAACSPSPPSPPPPAGVPVSGEVSVATPDRRVRGLDRVEVRFIPEAEMAPFVQARLGEALAQVERLRREGERLGEEVRRLQAENDRLNQRWRATMERDLHRRLALQVSRDLSARQVQAAQADLVRQKRAAWDGAQRAARQAEAKEREVMDLRRAQLRFRDGSYFLEGLPAAAHAATTDAAGRFETRLGAGRYAVVASAPRPPSEGGAWTWLVWAEVGPARAGRLALTDANLHGTDCPECVVAVGGLPR